MGCPWLEAGPQTVVPVSDVCPAGLTQVAVSSAAQFASEINNISGKHLVLSAGLTVPRFTISGQDDWCIDAPGGATVLHSGGGDGATIHIENVDNAGLRGLTLDGNNGTATWGLTLSGRFLNDPASNRPVTNFTTANLEITGQAQGAYHVGGLGTRNITSINDYLHDWGYDAQGDGFFAEGFYIGNGSDRSQSDSTNVHIINPLVHTNGNNGSSGEFVDIKNNTGRNGTLTHPDFPGQTFGVIVEGGDFYDNLQPFNAVLSGGENGASAAGTNTSDNVPGPTTLFYNNAIHDYRANGNAQGGPLPSSAARAFQLGRGTYTLVNNLVWNPSTSPNDALVVLDNAAPGESVTAYHNGFTGGVDVNNPGNQTYSNIAPALDFGCNWHTDNYDGPGGGSILASPADFNNQTSNSGHMPVAGGGLEDTCPTPLHPTDICGTARSATNDEAGPFSLASCCFLPTAQASIEAAIANCGVTNLAAANLVACGSLAGATLVDGGGVATMTDEFLTLTVTTSGTYTVQIDDGC